MAGKKSLVDLTVEDVMTREVITVNIDVGAADIVKVLAEKKVSGLIVVDFAGDVVGVISAIDVFKLLENGVFYGEDIKAEDMMTPFTISANPEVPLVEAARTMLERGVHRLIVTKSPSRKKPVGIVSSTDVIREISNIL